MIPMIDYRSGRVVIATMKPTVYVTNKKKNFNLKQQKQDILQFDQRHGTQCVKALEEFNNKYSKYIPGSYLSYATQMYFLSTEKKIQNLYGKILLMSEREEIIRNVVGGIKNNQFRNDLQSIFLEISFMMPTVDLKLGFTKIMEELLWHYTWDTRGKNFDYLPHTPIAGDKQKSEKFSLLNSNMCLDLEKEIQLRDKMLVNYFQKHNLDVNMEEVAKIAKACKRLNYDQLETLLNKEVRDIQQFPKAASYLTESINKMGEDLQSIITHYDYLRTFFNILKYGFHNAPLLTRRMLEKKASEYMERSADILNLAVFASENKLYFGKEAQTTTKTVQQRTKFKKLRGRQMLQAAKKFTQLNEIKKISEEYEAESTLDENNIKPNKKSTKPSNKKKKKTPQKSLKKDYREYRVYANSVLTKTILKTKPVKNKKNNEELKDNAPEVSNENQNDKEMKVKESDVPQKKDVSLVEKGSIVIFRNFALNKTQGFINRCKLCSKTYTVSNDEGSQLNGIIQKSNKLLKQLDSIDPTNVSEVNEIFENLKAETDTVCLKIATLHKKEVRRQELLEFQNNQFQSFCKNVIKQMGRERLMEARNRGGRVYFKGVPDIWERCYEKFHNRPFIYPGQLQFLDSKRCLGPDETLAYYVTQSSNTNGVSFCISVHRWKRVETTVDDDGTNNDNTSSNTASSGGDNLDTDININFRPLEKLNPSEWQDLDRVLENSFVVLHVTAS